MRKVGAASVTLLREGTKEEVSEHVPVHDVDGAAYSSERIL